MAYWEFYCNAMDEGGEVRVTPSVLSPPAELSLRYAGLDVARAHQNRHEMVVQRDTSAVRTLGPRLITETGPDRSLLRDFVSN